MSREKASIKADIWSYGVLVWEIVTGEDITDYKPLAVSKQVRGGARLHGAGRGGTAQASKQAGRTRRGGGRGGERRGGGVDNLGWRSRQGSWEGGALAGMGWDLGGGRESRSVQLDFAEGPAGLLGTPGTWAHQPWARWPCVFCTATRPAPHLLPALHPTCRRTHPPTHHTQMGVTGPKTLQMPPDAPSVAKRIFEACTQMDPQERPSCSQIVAWLRADMAGA